MAAKLRLLRPGVAMLALGRVAVAGAGAGASGFRREDGRSSAARGYGADWRRVRAMVLAREPLCRECARLGVVRAATDVDHVESFAGLDDPRRLDPNNLRPMCQPCHMARTAAQARGEG